MGWDAEREDLEFEAAQARYAANAARRSAAEERLSQLGPDGLGRLGAVESFTLMTDLGLSPFMGSEPAYGPPSEGEIQEALRGFTIRRLEMGGKGPGGL